MAPKISRRAFGKVILTGLAGSALGLAGFSSSAFASSKRVVVIGGGFGGVSAARYLRQHDPSIKVVLVEPKAVYYTCPLSNWVFSGHRELQELAQTYTALENRYGVDVIPMRAEGIDPIKKIVTLNDGSQQSYDRLVVSPGVALDWAGIDGYTRQISESTIPHAYEAGVQTTLLRNQLLAMRDGGTVLICPPSGQFRCPVAPYERASLIAFYLQQHKPKSKIIILDDKDGFFDQDQFMKGWERFYAGMIEWRGAIAGGKVWSVDAKSMTVETDFGGESADVINIIPSQKAGKIAQDTGLADDTGWCPVDPMTFESSIHPGIYVVGDASNAAPMPKSGDAASRQGRVAAAAIISDFNGDVPSQPTFGSTCYSLIRPGYGLAVKGVFTTSSGQITPVPGAGYMTPFNATDRQYEEDSVQGVAWYEDITSRTWG